MRKKFRKKKTSPHNFGGYKVLLLQLACRASYVSPLYHADKENVHQQRMPVKDIYGWLSEETRILFWECVNSGFIFSSDSYAKAQLWIITFILFCSWSLDFFSFWRVWKKHEMQRWKEKVSNVSTHCVDQYYNKLV